MNGRNVLTIDYDRSNRTDLVKNANEQDLLTIYYNDAGMQFELLIGLISSYQSYYFVRSIIVNCTKNIRFGTNEYQL